MPELRSASKIAQNKKIKLKFFNLPKQSNVLQDLKFTIKKYKSENDTFKKMYFSCFCEFGCEALLPTFLIPRIVKNYDNYKIIILGWEGREYFYKHLCDEFWELDKSQMPLLRSKAKAFQHNSRVIGQLETILRRSGVLIDGSTIGNLCVNSTCLVCQKEFPVQSGDISCMNCGSVKIKKSLLQGVKEYKYFRRALPNINPDLEGEMQNLIPSNSVGLFARNRETYGRNFSASHYKKIIDLFNDMGFNVVLLGEPVSSLNLNHPNVINLLNHKLAGNLEFAFAAVKRCMFTFQMYTASTRISSLLNVPYILVESADQIYGRGQEGIRLSLTTADLQYKKLILSNYINTLENFDQFLVTLEKTVSSFIFDKNPHDVFFNSEETMKMFLNYSGVSLW